jgi:hypothetical protein
MAGAGDVIRATRELRQGQQDMLDAVSGLGSGAKGFFSDLAGFFARPENLLALIICLTAVVGIYRLLRSEHIIPAPSRPGVGSMLASPMARSLVTRMLVAIILAALGLAALTGRLSGLADLLQSLF